VSGRSLVGEGVLDSVDEVELTSTFLGLVVVGFHLDGTPNVLDAEGFSLVFEANDMVFKGFRCLGNGLLIGHNSSFKVCLSLCESLVLFLEMG